MISKIFRFICLWMTAIFIYLSKLTNENVYIKCIFPHDGTLFLFNKFILVCSTVNFFVHKFVILGLIFFLFFTRVYYSRQFSWPLLSHWKFFIGRLRFQETLFQHGLRQLSKQDHSNESPTELHQIHRTPMKNPHQDIQPKTLPKLCYQPKACFRNQHCRVQKTDLVSESKS